MTIAEDQEDLNIHLKRVNIQNKYMVLNTQEYQQKKQKNKRYKSINKLKKLSKSTTLYKSFAHKKKKFQGVKN